MKQSEWNEESFIAFRQAFVEAYDFARCERPDGSHYGTGGVCRKGVEVEPKEHNLMSTAKHQAAHLGQSVAAWEVGKVVGGMASQYLEAQYGIPSESSKLLAETMVQGTAATALAVATKDLDGKSFVRRAMTEYAAAFLGKSAHGQMENAMSSFQTRAIVEQGAPLVAGKATGLTTAIAGAKVPTVAQMTSTVAEKATRDLGKTMEFLKSNAGKLGFNYAEGEVDPEVVEFLTDIFVLTGLLMDKRGDMPFAEA